MAGIIAFIISLALVVVAAMAGNATKLPLIHLLILGTATWAAWDSTQIRLREYKSGVALHPVALWFGIALLWIVGFP